MDLKSSARQCGVIPPEKVDSFLSCVTNVRDFIWTLAEPHRSEERLQGDLFRDFPLALVDPTGNPRCRKLTVMVLNNTCDLQPKRSEFVTVAPVFDFLEFSRAMVAKRGESKAGSFLAAVKANHVYELLWLPPFGSFGSGAVVFLDSIGAVASAVYESALTANSRLASFSQNGFYFLLIKLTKHLARPESDEVLRQD
jgi:hypothetical protein